MPALYRYVYYRVGNRQEAEDITETVFLRAWQALPRFRKENVALTAWLYRIGHNAVIDHYRASKRHTALDGTVALKGDPLPDVVAAEEAESLRVAVASLPEEQSQVLVLRFVEDLGHDEVAAVLGKSAGACRMIQHRALHALSRILGERR